MSNLSGKVAIVTGASRGIGAAIVKKLADEGAQVVACARSIESCEGAALCRKVDVSNSAEVDACVKTTVEKFGKVDILVNNAGITKDGLLMRMSDDDWSQVLDINLKGYDTEHAAEISLSFASRPMALTAAAPACATGLQTTIISCFSNWWMR